MICEGESVDHGQGFAHGEEVDVFVCETELPSERAGGAVNGDRIRHGYPERGQASRGDRGSARPGSRVEDGARGVGVTRMGVSEGQRAGNLIEGRRVAGIGQLGQRVWRTGIRGQYRPRVSDQRDGVSARANILYTCAEGAGIDEKGAAV